MRIFPRKGKYRLYWYVDYHENGKRVRRSYKSKAEAEAFRDGRAVARIRQLSGQEPLIKSNKISLTNYMTRYFDYIGKVNQPQTVIRDRSRLKAFINYIQIRDLKYLDQISISIMAEFQSDYLNSHSRKSWNNLLGLIKTMLSRAVDWELIPRNPILSLKPLKIDKRFNYFDRADLARIIAACPDNIRDAVIILASAGIRRGELYNLRWRDIDFKSRKLIVRGHKDIGTRTKGGNIRSIPLSDTLYGLLLKRKTVIRGDYVCRPFDDQNSLRRAFVRILKQLDLTGTLHDLRHTFASHLAMAGVPIPVISELLGHSNIQTTMIYAHLSPDSHKEAIKHLNFVPELRLDDPENI